MGGDIEVVGLLGADLNNSPHLAGDEIKGVSLGTVGLGLVKQPNGVANGQEANVLALCQVCQGFADIDGIGSQKGIVEPSLVKLCLS